VAPVTLDSLRCVRWQWEWRAPQMWKGESGEPQARPRKTTGDGDANQCLQCGASQRPGKLVPTMQAEIHQYSPFIYNPLTDLQPRSSGVT
jgi:hypothetical protein